MAKKFLLHRITEEDASYISEDTYNTRRDEINGGNCYLLINKDNGKIFRENGQQLLIYKASGTYTDESCETNSDKRKFMEAVEACAYFRGYANTHNIKFKTPKISELLYKLEDHEIEIPSSCNQSKVVYSANMMRDSEVADYMETASEGYDVLYKMQRNLPTLALFIQNTIPEQLRFVPQEEAEVGPEFDEGDFDFDEDFEDEEELLDEI